MSVHHVLKLFSNQIICIMSKLRNSTYYARGTHATTQARNKYFKPCTLSLFLTEMTPVTSSSSEMMKPRPAEDAKYMKLFFPGFPLINRYNYLKQNIKILAQFCKYWTCVMFVIIAISSIYWLVLSHKLSVSVTELPSAGNFPICILLSSEVKVFFNVFFAGFPSSASLLEQSLSSRVCCSESEFLALIRSFGSRSGSSTASRNGSFPLSTAPAAGAGWRLMSESYVDIAIKIKYIFNPLTIKMNNEECLWSWGENSWRENKSLDLI